MYCLRFRDVVLGIQAYILAIISSAHAPITLQCSSRDFTSNTDTLSSTCARTQGLWLLWLMMMMLLFLFMLFVVICCCLMLFVVLVAVINCDCCCRHADQHLQQMSRELPTRVHAHAPHLESQLLRLADVP